MNFKYETPRLTLKVLTPDYLREVLDFQLRNRELFEKYEPDLPDNFYTLSHQQAILKCEHKLAVKMSTIRFYVFLNKTNGKTDRRIIGTVCLHDIVRSAYSCCEVGYKFDREWQHRGYAGEALKKAVEIAFKELELHRVFARVVPDNERSIRLLETAGFIQEGLERESILIQGKWTDHLRYAMICPSCYSSINRYQ